MLSQPFCCMRIVSATLLCCVSLRSQVFTRRESEAICSFGWSVRLKAVVGGLRIVW